MKASELISKLHYLLHTEGNKEVVIDQEKFGDYLDIVDVVGKNYSHGNKHIDVIYLVIESTPDD